MGFVTLHVSILLLVCYITMKAVTWIKYQWYFTNSIKIVLVLPSWTIPRAPTVVENFHYIDWHHGGLMLRMVMINEKWFTKCSHVLCKMQTSFLILQFGFFRVGPQERNDMSKAWSLAADPPKLREFKLKHRALKKNWELPESFPSAVVIQVCPLSLLTSVQ